MTDARKPIMNFSKSGISIAAWTGTKSNTFSIKKKYRTQTGEWKETNSYFVDDLQTLYFLIMEAIHWEAEQRHTKTKQKNEQVSQTTDFDPASLWPEDVNI